MKERRGNNLKFTPGTDGRIKDHLKMLLDESVICPHFLPLDTEDVTLNHFEVYKAMMDEDQGVDIPLGELARKSAYLQNCKDFMVSIADQGPLLKAEVLKKLTHFDRLYGIQKTERDI